MQRFELERRVEPALPGGDLGEGFSARLGDPVWLLARQWQLGEHQGENASSPVTISYRVASAPIEAPHDRPGAAATVVPTESMVEGEAEDWWTYGRRIRLGRAAAAHLPPQPVPALALHGLPPPYDEHRGYDGRAVWRSWRAGHQPALPAALFAEVPAGRGNHWDPAELVYTTSLPCGGGRLEVRRHDGTEIDWWSADAAGTVRLTPAPAIATTPTRFEYPGAPLPRWWQIEDHTVDIGGYPPDRGHLATLFLIDLVCSHANDWFVFALALPGGAVAELRDVKVTDAFGRTHPVKAPADWSLFAVDGLGPASVFVPQTTAVPLVGEVTDEVVLGVDEDANALWGVILRRDGSAVPASPPDPPVPLVQPTDGPGVPLKFEYRPSSAVPHEWLPYRIDTVGGRRRSVQRRLAELNETPPHPVVQPEPPSELLDDPHSGHGPAHQIEPATVPASGLRLERRWVLSRGSDGRPVLWLQRTRVPLTAPPSKTLRFDDVQRRV
jgi:hypothetical protein